MTKTPATHAACTAGAGRSVCRACSASTSATQVAKAQLSSGSQAQ
jgi:hypothetical protein